MPRSCVSEAHRLTLHIPTTREHGVRPIPIRIRTLCLRMLCHGFDPSEGVRGNFRRDFNNEVIPPVYVSVSQTIYVNSVLLMTLNLTHLGRNPEIPEPPPVYFRRISVKVIDNVLARVYRVQEFAIFGEAVDVKNQHTNEKIQLACDGLEFQDITDLMFRDTAPEFRSYPLSWTHDIKVKVRVPVPERHFI